VNPARAIQACERKAKVGATKDERTDCKTELSVNVGTKRDGWAMERSCMA
jgi:hypothetical protein